MYYIKAKLKKICDNNNNPYKTIAVVMADFVSWLVIINYLSECMPKSLNPDCFLADISRFLVCAKVSNDFI